MNKPTDRAPIACPRCAGHFSPRCPYCKGSGILAGDDKLKYQRAKAADNAKLAKWQQATKA